MRKRRFIQCDVFSATPTKGNGLAVVVDAEGLDDRAMQGFAAWTNLAETTFLFPPTDPAADYKVRIFTPSREMPFAGHPTLGSCAAWLHAGGAPRSPKLVRQECEIGLIDIHMDGKTPAFVAPPTRIEPLETSDLDAVLARLEISPANVVRSARLDNGPVWQAIELATAADVLAVDASRVRYPEFLGVGLIGPHPPRGEIDYEVRMLAPSSGMSEDPITGSLNAALARWMQSEGRLSRDIIVSQGVRANREGRVFISLGDAGDVLIGGETQVLIDGAVTL